MRILVTGATGFVGSRLVETLVREGHELRALSRSPRRARESLPGISEAYPWDGLTAPPPEEAVQGVDVVIHLAGEPVSGRWTASRRKAIRESRVLGTAQLVASLARAASRPRRLVSASAIGYYGDRGDETLTEASEAGSGFLADVSRGWEAAALEAEPLGVEVTRVRIGIVLGPDGGALGRMLPLYRKGLGGRLGSGRQWWSWIHQDDLVGLLGWAATAPSTPPRVMNAVAPDARQQRDFARALAQTLGRRLFLPAPGFALRAVLGGFSEELLGSKRCVPEAALEAKAPFRHPVLEEALADLLGANTP